MFEYFNAILRFPQSFMFTLIIFGLVGIVVFFMLLLNILSKQEKLMKRPSLWDASIHTLFHFLNKFFLLHYSVASKFLFELFELSKQKFNSKTYKYDQAYSLLLGDDGTVLQNINLPESMNRLFSADGQYSAHSFLQGALINCSDEAVNSNDYTELLQLLSNHRSMSPVDSVTVVFNCEIIGSNSEQANILLANQWGNKLLEINNITQLQLPVYLIFTGLESIKGFDTFAKLITQEQREEIFGWSSKFGLNSLPEDFAETACDDMLARLVIIQQSLLTITSNAKFAKDLILFVDNFKIFSNRLKLFLRYINSGTGNKSILIRGFYFIGKYEQQVIFNNQLWTKKIFIERGIAMPLSSYSFYKNYWLRSLQIALGLSIFTGGVIYLHNLSSLRSWYHQAHNRWSALDLLIKKYKKNAVSEKEHPVDIVFFIKQARLLESNDLLYKTIPTTYLSDSWHQTENTMVNLCQFLIINRLSEKLEYTIADFLAQLEKEGQYSYGTSLAESNQFKKFAYFINKLAYYKRLSDKLVNLPYNQDLRDLNMLLKSLYNISLGRVLIDDSVYLKAMNNIELSSIVWSKYGQTFNNLFKAISKNFGDILTTQFIEEKVAPLANNLDNLKTDNHNIYQAKQNLINLINWVEQEGKIIFSEEVIIIGNQWDKIIEDLNTLEEVVGSTLVKQEYKKLDEKFKTMKVQFLSSKLPILGYIVTQDDYGKLHLSPEYQKMLGLFNTLISQNILRKPEIEQKVKKEFFEKEKVAKGGKLKKNTKLMQNQYFNLSMDALNDANKKIDTFLTLSNDMPDNKTQDVYSTALLIISEELENKLILKEFLGLRAEKLTGATGYIVKILKFALHNNKNLFGKLYISLLNMLEKQVDQSYNQLLEDSNLYHVDPELLSVGFDPNSLQQNFSNDTKHLNTFLENIAGYLDIYQAIIEIDSSVEKNNKLDELLYIWKQVHASKTNTGDIVALQSSVIKVFADPDPYTASTKEKWSGKAGLFSRKFAHAMEVAKQLTTLKRNRLFKKDYEKLYNHYEYKLKPYFPFSLSDSQVDTSDLLENYKELDELLKSYPVTWIAEQVENNDAAAFVMKMVKARNLLEAYAKGSNDLMLNVNFRANKGAEELTNHLYQATLEFDNYKVDFRSVAQVPYKSYDFTKLRLTLANESEYTFENGEKEYIIKFNGVWSLWQFIYKYLDERTQNLEIKIPVLNAKKEQTMLKIFMKVEVMKQKEKIDWINFVK